MKKAIKVIGLIVLVLWIVVTTFVSYISIRNNWESIQLHQWEFLMPLGMVTQGTNNNLNLRLPTDEPMQFCERISPMKFDKLGLALSPKYTSGQLDPPDNSVEYLTSEFVPIFNQWPQALKNFAEDHIYQIVIVKNRKSSARIFAVQNSDKFIVIVNEHVLKQSPNDWIRESEETAFYYDTPTDEVLTFQIEMQDDPILTFENILIHEIGHAFGVVKGLTTDLNEKMNPCNSLDFFNEDYQGYIWLKRKNLLDDRYESLQYYREDILSFEQYRELLVGLEDTSYPTLYGATHPMEHFAETFYSYVHCELQKKPYRYILTTSDGKETIIENGIVEKRCARIKEIIHARLIE